MPGYRHLSIFVLFAFFAATLSYGQCFPVPGCNGGTIIGPITPLTSWQTVAATSGNIFTFAATLGNQYTFSFCKGGGAVGSFGAPEITLQNNAGTPIVCDNSSCFGTAELVWTATATANFRIHVTDFFCSGGGPGTMAYKVCSPAASGQTCASPIVVGALPYSQSGRNTCGHGDDYNSSDACSSVFMNGEDVVYAYTATGPECIQVTLSNTNPGSGLFVLDACPNAGGANCLANSGGSNSVSTVLLPAPGTYYVVVAGNDLPFDIDIEPCPTGDTCGNATPILTLPYTATGLTTSGFGDDYNSSMGCGSAYMNGDDYVFAYNAVGGECIDIFVSNTVTFSGVFLLDDCPNASGVNCIAKTEAVGGSPSIVATTIPTSGIHYIVVSNSPSPQSTPFNIVVDTCRPPTPCGANPPPKDSCLNATDISGYAQFCGDLDTNLYKIDIPGNLNSVFCGVIDNNSWLKFTADSTAAQFDFTVGPCQLGGGIQAQVFSTPDCINFTSVSNCFNPGTQQNGTVTATGLTVGQTYYLMVDGQAKDDCEWVVNYNGGPLPVEFGKFDLLQKEDEINLSWTTFTEYQNSGFSIQMGTPGTGQEPGSIGWETVKFIQGHMTSRELREYKTSLLLPPDGIERYFRIMQTDLDGYASYSPILSSKTVTITHPRFMNAWPNPTRNRMNVEFYLPEFMPVDLEIIDLTGKTLHSEAISEISEGVNLHELDLQRHPAGIYFLKLRMGTEVSMTRIVLTR